MSIYLQKLLFFLGRGLLLRKALGSWLFFFFRGFNYFIMEHAVPASQTPNSTSPRLGQDAKTERTKKSFSESPKGPARDRVIIFKPVRAGNSANHFGNLVATARGREYAPIWSSRWVTQVRGSEFEPSLISWSMSDGIEWGSIQSDEIDPKESTRWNSFVDPSRWTIGLSKPFSVTKLKCCLFWIRQRTRT